MGKFTPTRPPPQMGMREILRLVLDGPYGPAEGVAWWFDALRVVLWCNVDLPLSSSIRTSIDLGGGIRRPVDCDVNLSDRFPGQLAELPSGALHYGVYTLLESADKIALEMRLRHANPDGYCLPCDTHPPPLIQLCARAGRSLPPLLTGTAMGSAAMSAANPWSLPAADASRNNDIPLRRRRATVAINTRPAVVTPYRPDPSTSAVAARPADVEAGGDEAPQRKKRKTQKVRRPVQAAPAAAPAARPPSVEPLSPEDEQQAFERRHRARAKTMLMHAVTARGKKASGLFEAAGGPRPRSGTGEVAAVRQQRGTGEARAIRRPPTAEQVAAGSDRGAGHAALVPTPPPGLVPAAEAPPADPAAAGAAPRSPAPGASASAQAAPGPPPATASLDPWAGEPEGADASYVFPLIRPGEPMSVFVKLTDYPTLRNCLKLRDRRVWIRVAPASQLVLGARVEILLLLPDGTTLQLEGRTANLKSRCTLLLVDHLWATPSNILKLHLRTAGVSVD